MFPQVLRLLQWVFVFLATLAVAPVSARVGDVRLHDRGSLRTHCERDSLYLSFIDPRLGALASAFCSTFIRSTVREEATVTKTHTVQSTEHLRATIIATVRVKSVVGVVETDYTTSTTSETIIVTESTVTTATVDVPVTVATEVITVIVATETDVTTVATDSITATVTTITVVGRGYPDPYPGDWIYQHGLSELSGACSCILTKAPPARTIYTGTSTHVATKVVVTDITRTVTATKTIDILSTSTATTEIEVVATHLASQTTVVTNLVITTVEVPATETTTLDVTTIIVDDVTVTVTATATATSTCCECQAPFLLQVSGSSVNGQYLTFEYSAILEGNVLGFGPSSTASTFTLNSQCQLITGGYYSAIGQGDFYDVVREDTFGEYPLICSVNEGTLSCTDDAGQNLNNDEFSYNGLGYLAFETIGGGGGQTLTLNVIPA